MSFIREKTKLQIHKSVFETFLNYIKDFVQMHSYFYTYCIYLHNPNVLILGTNCRYMLLKEHVLFIHVETMHTFASSQFTVGAGDMTI